MNVISKGRPWSLKNYALRSTIASKTDELINQLVTDCQLIKIVSLSKNNEPSFNFSCFCNNRLTNFFTEKNLKNTIESISSGHGHAEKIGATNFILTPLKVNQVATKLLLLKQGDCFFSGVSADLFLIDNLSQKSIGEYVLKLRKVVGSENSKKSIFNRISILNELHINRHIEKIFAHKIEKMTVQRKLIGYKVNNVEVGYICEKYNGDLTEMDKILFNLETSNSFASQLLQCFLTLCKLHDNHIYHGDIKLDNIFYKLINGINSYPTEVKIFLGDFAGAVHKNGRKGYCCDFSNTTPFYASTVHSLLIDWYKNEGELEKQNCSMRQYDLFSWAMSVAVFFSHEDPYGVNNFGFPVVSQYNYCKDLSPEFNDLLKSILIFNNDRIVTFSIADLKTKVKALLKNKNFYSEAFVKNLQKKSVTSQVESLEPAFYPDLDNHMQF